MKGDFTRFSHDPRKHYTRVLKQQGRVELDSDQREGEDIHVEARRLRTVDVVGRTGAPVHDAGYGVLWEGGAFRLTPGRMYVDGILARLDADRHGRVPEPGQTIPYLDQPDLPDPAPIPRGTPALVYLDVWERPVTRIEDPGLRDSALDGVDTTTRTRTIAQVRWRALADDARCSDEEPWRALIAPPDGKAALWTREVPPGAKPCDNPTTGGYRGVENRLYRVQVHRGGVPHGVHSRDDLPSRNVTALTIDPDDASEGTLAVDGTDLEDERWRPGDALEIYSDRTVAGGVPGAAVRVTGVEDEAGAGASALAVATVDGALPDFDGDSGLRVRRVASYKWSRDNGSVAFAVQPFDAGDPARVRLQRLGRDALLAIRPADWVEVHGDESDLLGRPGTIARVIDADDGTRYVKLGADVSRHAAETHVKCRRWDSPDGPLPVRVGVAEELEDGVMVRFAGTAFRSGDHWTLAARTADALVPESGPVSPRGIRHRHARLAVVHWHGGPDADPEIHDCRRWFRPLTEVPDDCCLTVGDGVHSVGDYRDIQEAVDALPEGGGCVLVLPGDFPVREPVRLERDGVRLEGCDRRARVLASPGEPAVAVMGAGGCRVERLTLRSDGSDLGALLAVGSPRLSVGDCDVENKPPRGGRTTLPAGSVRLHGGDGPFGTQVEEGDPDAQPDHPAVLTDVRVVRYTASSAESAVDDVFVLKAPQNESEAIEVGDVLLVAHAGKAAGSVVGDADTTLVGQGGLVPAHVFYIDADNNGAYGIGDSVYLGSDERFTHTTPDGYTVRMTGHGSHPAGTLVFAGDSDFVNYRGTESRDLSGGRGDPAIAFFDADADGFFRGGEDRLVLVPGPLPGGAKKPGEAPALLAVDGPGGVVCSDLGVTSSRLSGHVGASVRSRGVRLEMNHLPLGGLWLRNGTRDAVVRGNTIGGQPGRPGWGVLVGGSVAGDGDEPLTWRRGRSAEWFGRAAAAFLGDEDMPMQDVIIEGNRISGMDEAGIGWRVLGGMRRLTVAANHVSGCATRPTDPVGAAVLLALCDDVTVQGNTITENGRDGNGGRRRTFGLLALGCRSLVLDGNRIDGNGVEADDEDHPGKAPDSEPTPPVPAPAGTRPRVIRHNLGDASSGLDDAFVLKAPQNTAPRIEVHDVLLVPAMGRPAGSAVRSSDTDLLGGGEETPAHVLYVDLDNNDEYSLGDAAYVSSTGQMVATGQEAFTVRLTPYRDFAAGTLVLAGDQDLVSHGGAVGKNLSAGGGGPSVAFFDDDGDGGFRGGVDRLYLVPQEVRPGDRLPAAAVRLHGGDFGSQVRAGDGDLGSTLSTSGAAAQPREPIGDDDAGAAGREGLSLGAGRRMLESLRLQAAVVAAAFGGPGRPSLRVHDNLFACPRGPALLAGAAGSCAIHDNELFAAGDWGIGAILRGRAVSLGVLSSQRSDLPARVRFEGNRVLWQAEGPPEPSPNVLGDEREIDTASWTRTLFAYARGDLSFEGNHVRADIRDWPPLHASVEARAHSARAIGNRFEEKDASGRKTGQWVTGVVRVVRLRLDETDDVFILKAPQNHRETAEKEDILLVSTQNAPAGSVVGDGDGWLLDQEGAFVEAHVLYFDDNGNGAYDAGEPVYIGSNGRTVVATGQQAYTIRITPHASHAAGTLVRASDSDLNRTVSGDLGGDGGDPAIAFSDDGDGAFHDGDPLYLVPGPISPRDALPTGSVRIHGGEFGTVVQPGDADAGAPRGAHSVFRDMDTSGEPLAAVRNSYLGIAEGGMTLAMANQADHCVKLQGAHQMNVHNQELRCERSEVDNDGGED